MRIRMWYQSATPMGHNPLFAPYLEEVQQAARRYARPETEITFHGMSRATMTFGTGSAYFRHLDELNIVHAAIEAEESGYDVFALGCGADPGLKLARETVTIPVIGKGQAALYFCLQLGDKLGKMEHEGSKAVDREVKEYGLEDSAVIEPHAGSVPDFAQAYTDHELFERLLASWTQAAKRCVARGAQSLISGCEVWARLLAREGVANVDGVPVVDALGALVTFAEAAALQRGVGGIRLDGGRPTSEQRQQVRSLFGV